MVEVDDEERQLRLQLLREDVANRRADTMLKDAQRTWEPWKAISAAVAATLAVVTASAAAGAWLVTHWPSGH